MNLEILQTTIACIDAVLQQQSGAEPASLLLPTIDELQSARQQIESELTEEQAFGKGEFHYYFAEILVEREVERGQQDYYWRIVYYQVDHPGQAKVMSEMAACFVTLNNWDYNSMGFPDWTKQKWRIASYDDVTEESVLLTVSVSDYKPVCKAEFDHQQFCFRPCPMQHLWYRVASQFEMVHPFPAKIRGCRHVVACTVHWKDISRTPETYQVCVTGLLDEYAASERAENYVYYCLLNYGDRHECDREKFSSTVQPYLDDQNNPVSSKQAEELIAQAYAIDLTQEQE